MELTKQERRVLLGMIHHSLSTSTTGKRKDVLTTLLQKVEALAIAEAIQSLSIALEPLSVAVLESLQTAYDYRDAYQHSVKITALDDAIRTVITLTLEKKRGIPCQPQQD